MSALLARAVVIFALLSVCGYGLLHALTCTPYFKDPARLRRIAIRVVLFVGAVLLATFVFSLVLTVDSVS